METSLGLDLSNFNAIADKANRHLESMARNSERIRDAIKSIGSDGGGTFFDLLNKMSTSLDKVGNQKVSINIDTTSVDKLFSSLKDAFSVIKEMSTKGSTIELFGGNDFSKASSAFLGLEKQIDEINKQIQRTKEELDAFSKVEPAKFTAEAFVPKINEKTGKEYGANTKVQQAAYAEYQERMRLAEEAFNAEQKFSRDAEKARLQSIISTLEAQKQAAAEEQGVYEMTQSQRLSYVKKAASDMLATEIAAAERIQKEFNETYEKVNQLRAERNAIAGGKDGKNLSAAEQATYNAKLKQEEDLVARLRQIYEKHQQDLTAISTKSDADRGKNSENSIEATIKSNMQKLADGLRTEREIVAGAISDAMNATSGSAIVASKHALENAMAIVKPDDIAAVNALNTAYDFLMAKLNGIATTGDKEKESQLSRIDVYRQLIAELNKFSSAQLEVEKAGESINKINQLATQISEFKLSPTVDTASLERLSEVLAKNFNIASNIAHTTPNIDFFNTKNIYDTGEGLLQAKKLLADTNNDIAQVEAAYFGVDEAIDEMVSSMMQFKEKQAEIPEFQPLINEKTGKPYGDNTSAQRAHKEEYDRRVESIKAATAEENRVNREAFEKIKSERVAQITATIKAELEAERAALQEYQRAYQERVKFFKMTVDERLEYTRRKSQEEEKLHADSIKKVQAEYKKMLSDENDIIKSVGKIKKSGVDNEETRAQLDDYYNKLEEINSKRRQHEEMFGEYLVEIGEQAERRLLNIRLENIKREREERLATPQGALDFAAQATTRGQKEEAKKYITKALDNVDEKDVQMVEKLRTEYIKLRGDIEEFNKGLKNEQTLQPTIHNEYERQLKTLDKLIDAKKRATETDAYKSGDAKAIENYEAIVAREKDVRGRIELLEKTLQEKLAETKRKHLAENAMAELAETEKLEAQKAEIAKKRFKEQIAERSKMGTVSTASANRMVDILERDGSVSNATQAQRAIEKLNAVKKNLNTTDQNYEKTLSRINNLIDKHTETLKRATDAQYAKKKAEEKAHAKNTTFQGALDYSKQTKNINDQVKAIQYLKEARDKLSRKDNPEYENQVKRLNIEIRRQQDEVDKLKGKQDLLKDSQKSLSNTAQQLQRRLTSLFSIQSITGYIEKVITVRGEFEKQQKTLGAILQDVDKTNELWKQTVDLAVKSPFRVKELVTYTKQLAAYRIETDKLHSSTKMLADISAGLGVDMNRLILAYGQVKAANYLRGTELRQFSEAGINVLQELATYFSEIEGRAVSVGDVFDRVSKRLVSFQDVDTVLQRVTGEGGVFYRMQEQQSHTIEGMRMNLKDSIDLMLDEIGKANEDTIKWGLNTTKGVVENWKNIAHQIKLIIPILGLYKLRTWACSDATKIASKDTLWWNKKLKEQGLTMVKYAKTLGFADMKILGLSWHQVLAAKATATLQVAVKGLLQVLKSVGPMLGISLGVMLVSKLFEAKRAARELKKELNGIINEDLGNFNKNKDGFQGLIGRLERANELGLDRSKIIGQLNSQYGEYLDFVVTEATTVDELSQSYENVVARMKEKQAMKTYEKGVDAIEESYRKELPQAKEEFYEMFKGNSVSKQNGQFDFTYIAPSEKEIDELYSIVQQKVAKLNSDEIDSLQEQSDLIQNIISDYYGAGFKLDRDYLKQIKLLDILIEKKKQEEELQKEIDAIYSDTLSSREANLAMRENKLKYAEKRRAIEERPTDENFTKFDKNKALEQLREQEQLDVIDIKVRFGAMSEAGGEKAKEQILNWASEISKSINETILIDLGNVDTEELKNLDTEIKNVGKEMEEQFKGNVDLLNRKMIPATKLAAKGWKNVGDGYATVFSYQRGVTDSKGNNVEILVTPILPNGDVLTEGELNTYIDKELNGAKDILAADDKGIVIKVGVSKDGDAGEQLHLMQEQYYNMIAQRKALFSGFSEEELTSVMVTKDIQSQKNTAEYLKTLQSNLQRERELLAEAVSLQSAGVHDYSEEIAQHERKIELHEKVLNLLGVETEGTKKLSEETRNAINEILPDDMKITFEEAYSGIDTIISEIQKKETQIANIIKQQNHLKKEGLPYDEEALNNAEEEYKWLKKKQDLIDESMKTPISAEKVTQINSKLKPEYQIDVIDSMKDEATLLSEANQKKDEAIAKQEQLNAQVAQGIILKEGELEQVKEEIKQWTLRWKLLGGTEKDKSSNDNLTDERIRVIDQMNKKFRELNETLSRSESIQGAFDAYKDAFEKAYKGTKFLKGLNMKKMTPEEFIEKVFNFPDRDDVVRILDDLTKIVPKLDDKIKVQLAKGTHEAEMKVKVRTDLQTDVLEKVEQMFEGYDISLELKELDVPKDFAKRLFGVTPIELPELKSNVINEFSTVTQYVDEIEIASNNIRENFSDIAGLIDTRTKTAADFNKKGWLGVEKDTFGLDVYNGNDDVYYTITPVLPNGDIMTSEQLSKYLDDIIAQANGDMVKLKQLDVHGLIIDYSLTPDAFYEVTDAVEQYYTLLKKSNDEQKAIKAELSKGLGNINWEYITDALGAEQAEKVREFLQKIDEMEKDAAEERVKKYLQYIREEQYERVKLKLEEVRKLREIEEMEGLTDTEKKTMRTNIKDEYGKKEAELRWKEFADTPMIIQMFDDLDKLSNKALNGLHEKLTTLKKDLYNAGLPASELSEILDKIRQIEEKMSERTPFKNFGKGIKNLLGGGLKDARDSYDKQLKEQEKANSDVGLAEDKIAAYLNRGGKEGTYHYNHLLKNLNKATDKAEKMQKETDKMADNLREAQSSAVNVANDMKLATDYVQEVGSSVIDLIDSFGGFATDAGKEVAETALSIMGNIGGIAEAAGKIASGDVVGGIVTAVSSVASLIANINKASDASKDIDIEKQAALIEKLEASYEKLEKAIDKAYSTEDLRKNTEDAQNNLQQQIDAIEKQKAAEQDKKNADQNAINDYNRQIDELRAKQEELAENMYSTATSGFFDDITSAAENFIDAWANAFKETGDGLSGLEQSFNDMIVTMVKRTLSLTIVGEYIAKWQDILKKYVGGQDLEFTTADAKSFAEDVKNSEYNLENFNSSMAGLGALLEEFGIDTENNLSGLQAGISGITEEQADILAAYWNSVRFSVTNIEAKLDTIIQNQSNSFDVNPIVSSLKDQTDLISSIYTILNRLTTPTDSLYINIGK